MKKKGVEVYMDVIIVHGKAIEEHDWRLIEVMEKLNNYKMRVNPAKLQFRTKEVRLLGVIIDGKNQMPSVIKKNEVLEYPRPRNMTELRRFLGLAGWLRSFIKEYARKVEKMTKGLKKKDSDFN
ncbi:hypothetical protein PAEPH01_1964 [Pancytospora epiphaga]|nr:hypothetical protein PAEPH01_1964 [Pancytospora epiphaga]